LQQFENPISIADLSLNQKRGWNRSTRRPSKLL